MKLYVVIIPDNELIGVFTDKNAAEDTDRRYQTAFYGRSDFWDGCVREVELDSRWEYKDV